MADIGSCPKLVRTRFLGLSVIDFSCSAGWNEQPSEITINLVQDCATDALGNVHEERFGVLQGGGYPDPLVPSDRAQNVVQPSMGSLHTFVLYQPEVVTIHKGPPFKFMGCLQSINKSIGADGNPVCSVKLVSPHFLLENAQVILDHYEGGVNFYNIIIKNRYLLTSDRKFPLPQPRDLTILLMFMVI